MLCIIFLFLVVSTTKIARAQSWEKLAVTSDYVNVVERSPWGILIGEFDQRLWRSPNNGVLISSDFGKSFHNLGLQNTGITDIKYFNEKIYSTTFYFKNGEAGLFVSNDKGVTWNHLNQNFSATRIERDEKFILLGTYSHGIWISEDEGETWKQYFGDGFYGEKIQEIFINEFGYFITVNGNTYKSTDTKEWIKVSNLSEKYIKSINGSQRVLLASGNGLYKSLDGTSWEYLPFFGTEKLGPITFFDNNFYISAKNQQTASYEVFISKDFGTNWEDLGMPNVYNEGLAFQVDWVFSNPSFLLATVPMEGIYKFNIPDFTEVSPFLNVPWEYNSPAELIETIYSFFDHSYPLLGYPYFREPDEHKDTTTNYFGIKETEPKFYYSSHDGIDFALKYGTPILAAYEGLASYAYDPTGLGHYIKINHQNGFETTYAHLQNIDLVTLGQNFPVLEGQQIGLVGMSGNTTGPHLHFSVEKTNVNKPENRIDPFGWKNKFIQDPWLGFYWSDNSGIHIGSKSFNLWKVDPKYNFLSNKQLIVEENSSEYNFTVFIEPYIYPKVPISQNKLTYITGTSMIINAYNILGQKIPEFLQPAKIEIDISHANLDNIYENSLKIYKWNEEEMIWKHIPSTYDSLTKIIRGETLSFSKFAVFGINKNAWNEKAKIYNVSLNVM